MGGCADCEGPGPLVGGGPFTWIAESHGSVSWPVHATPLPRIADLACAGGEGLAWFVGGITRIGDRATLPRIGEVAHCLAGCWACGLLDFGAFGLLVGWAGGLGHQGTPTQAMLGLLCSWTGSSAPRGGLELGGP